MSQPVKLSDALVLDARIAGEVQERSIAGQVEFWAKLGQSIDLLLNGRQIRALRQSGAARPLSEALAEVDTPAGRRRVELVLANRPYPHYTQCPGRPGWLIRIDQNGTQTVGRFVNRVFAEDVKAGHPPREVPTTKKKTAKKTSPKRATSDGSTGLSQARPKEQTKWA